MDMMKFAMVIICMLGIAIVPTFSAKIGPNDLWRFNSPMNFVPGENVDVDYWNIWRTNSPMNFTPGARIVQMEPIDNNPSNGRGSAAEGDNRDVAPFGPITIVTITNESPLNVSPLFDFDLNDSLNNLSFSDPHQGDPGEVTIIPISNNNTSTPK